MNKVISFIKKDAVLFISIILAVISCFFVVPDAQYLSYIDLRTLALLFCLMVAVAGFTDAGLFSLCANRLLKMSHTCRGVVAALTLLCFFFSPFITNDVALITFVPFAITVLTLAHRSELIPITVVLQTVAANMGSCLTPIGNPQNIYIYSISDLSFGEFFLSLLPFGAVTLIFLLVCLLFIKRESLEQSNTAAAKLNCKKTVFYAFLFVISLLSVLKVVDYRICFVLIAIALLIFDRSIFLKVDYSLLITFVGFFVFVGNMGRLPFFREQIELLLQSKEVFSSALISQVISNVPAALLLSGFTENLTALLIGVNIGGLGTLIASMASLISYKFVASSLPSKKGYYFLLFSVVNFVLLAVMLLLNLIINGGF